MRRFEDHSLRAALTDELHARPFTPLAAPAEIMMLALIPETPSRDRAAVNAHLAELLAHFGQPPAQDLHGINHRLFEAGDLMVRWERHTEFVTVTVTRLGAPSEPFSPDLAARLPEGWIDRAPGRVMAAVLLNVVAAEPDAEAMLKGPLGQAFAAESLAAAWVTSRQALAMSDFLIDENGFTRIAIAATPEIGPRRLGRIAQRLIELEIYRSLAMLALPVARSVAPRLDEIDQALAEVVQGIAAKETVEGERETLEKLTELAAEVEQIAAAGAYRYSAARAYETIVNERIQALREERVSERQTFFDFMLRRFKPAMRTCRSVDDRLAGLASRASRAANLLRTRVDVKLEAQNQELLHSMNRRAQLQLRLQQTVEGLSVVAISYYAVSLAGYLLAPLAHEVGLEDKVLKALVALPIIAAVWLFVRQIKKHVHEE